MTSSPSESIPRPSVTLGEYAHQILAAQYRQIRKHETKVLADQNPEHLHQMRVGTRRLRVALQVFTNVVKLPGAAGETRLRDLARILGTLRDLDVQQEVLQQEYYPHLEKAEQRHLDLVLKRLCQDRQRAFTQVETALTHRRYHKLKAAYEAWLTHPQGTAIAPLPLLTVLPDLLSPLLASLLLHPAWLLAPEAMMDAEGPMHDLRKACKRVRYQAEFFQSFYGEALNSWLDDIKQIQELLGQVHDTQVLLQILDAQTSSHQEFPGIKRAIAQKQQAAITHWEPWRQKYLNPDFRQTLRLMILQPDAKSQAKTAVPP